MDENLIQIEQEEQRKQRYRQVLGELSIVKGNISNLQDSLDSLRSEMNVSLLINEEMFEQALYDEIKGLCNQISSNIGDAISVVNSKI